VLYDSAFPHEAIIRQLNILPVPDDGFEEKPKHVACLGKIFVIDGPPPSTHASQEDISPVHTVVMFEFRSEK